LSIREGGSRKGNRVMSKSIEIRPWGGGIEWLVPTTTVAEKIMFSNVVGKC